MSEASPTNSKIPVSYGEAHGRLKSAICNLGDKRSTCLRIDLLRPMVGVDPSQQQDKLLQLAEAAVNGASIYTPCDVCPIRNEWAKLTERQSQGRELLIDEDSAAINIQ